MLVRPDSMGALMIAAAFFASMRISLVSGPSAPVRIGHEAPPDAIVLLDNSSHLRHSHPHRLQVLPALGLADQDP